MSFIIPIILCGGSGTRLWPCSRPTLPKQCLPLVHPEQTLVQQTIARVQHPMFTAPILITHAQLAPLLRTQLGEDVTMLIEPQGYNTAPAIAAALCHVRSTYGDEAIIVVMPADHAIANEHAWHCTLGDAAHAAQHRAVILCGIVPDAPSTAYGYIHYTHTSSSTQPAHHVPAYHVPAHHVPAHHVPAHHVISFHEKPDSIHAHEYYAQGTYLWNSGMIIARADYLWERMQHHIGSWLPQIASAYADAAHDRTSILLATEHYTSIPSISFDYAVLEHLQDAYVVRMDCGWSDVGTWEALWHWLPHDEHDNVILGAIEHHNCSGCYIYAEAGMHFQIEHHHNQIIIATRDALLIRARAISP